MEVAHLLDGDIDDDHGSPRPDPRHSPVYGDQQTAVARSSRRRRGTGSETHVRPPPRDGAGRWPPRGEGAVDRGRASSRPATRQGRSPRRISCIPAIRSTASFAAPSHLAVRQSLPQSRVSEENAGRITPARPPLQSRLPCLAVRSIESPKLRTDVKDAHSLHDAFRLIWTSGRSTPDCPPWSHRCRWPLWKRASSHRPL